MPSSQASEPAQLQIMSLPQRYRSFGSSADGMASSRGVASESSPYEGRPRKAKRIIAGVRDALASVAERPSIKSCSARSKPSEVWLTLGPALLSLLVIAADVAIPLLGEGDPAPPDAGKVLRAWVAVRRALVTGTAEALATLRSGNVLVIAGAIGYWAWDNAVLWATFHAIGVSPGASVILLGYLIGQLGGLLPIPGGIGGIDGGLIGTLVLYGAAASPATAAVVAYRVVLFWVPLLLGAAAFVALRRSMARLPQGAGDRLML